MKKVLLIGTGGTIASELSAQALAPALTSEQLLQYVPQVSRLCRVDCLQLCSLDSTNITPAHYLALAEVLHRNYFLYDGFVICHGTDTMAYTAAALSYLVQRAAKPIVLTGAQKPIGSDVTDSKTNLCDAFRCAISGLSGVMVVFNGRVIAGTRAKKTRSKSFQAFSSINYPVLAELQDGYLFEYIHPTHADCPVFYDKLEPRVGLLKLIPGASPELLAYYLQNYVGVIIESFGVGGLPTYEDNAMQKILRHALSQGRTVVLTTQVQNEGSNASVYQVGFPLKHELGILEGYDMTTEAVTAKLMWVLGQTQKSEEIRHMFYTPVASDLLYTNLQ